MKRLIPFLLTILIVSSCTNAEKQSIDQCPVIANYHKFNTTDSILVCDYASIEDTIELPLSFFADDLRIVPLDNRQEVLEKPDAEVCISEKYVALANWNTPIGLYDKSTGQYLRTIGNIGQGPQDYFSPANIEIAEKQNIISVYTNKQIKLYNLTDGKYIHSIKFGYNNPQRNISHLDLDQKKLTVIESPNVNGQKINIWQQNLNSKVTDSLSVSYYQKMDTPEPHGYFDTEKASFYLFNRANVADTLFNYNYQKNSLIPKFTIKWKEEIPSHFLQELPRHYLCIFGDFLKWQHIILVNKQSGRGAFVKILIDLYDLNGMYWNELFPTLKLKGGNSFSFLTDPLNICEKTKNHIITIDGKTWDEDALQEENSWLVTGKWK